MQICGRDVKYFKTTSFIDFLHKADHFHILHSYIQQNIGLESKAEVNFGVLDYKNISPLDIVTKVVKSNKESRYIPYLLNLISKYCNPQLQEHQEAGRQFAASLLTTIINRCSNIDMVMSLVHRTEANLTRVAEDKHHPWEFLQKRPSTMRATKDTYTCLNKIDASQTWISIMARAQDRIMELAKSAQNLSEDSAVSAFLGKKTRYSFFSHSMADEYKSLCKTKSLSTPVL